MTTPILHHYPPSLFSEKIRMLLGYLGLAWHSVIIPPIMPRPHLMPLSGGYRKTPILQIGANIYCDSEVISRTLAQIAADTTLYAPGFAAERMARWADTELFRICVALNFRPEALAAQMSQLSEAQIAAFQADRAQLSGDAPLVSLDPDAALAAFSGLLEGLEESLAADFLFGGEPCIADFSLYHCLWFVSNNPVNQALFEPWPGVRNYLQRMQAFGHGEVAELDAAEALQIGTDAQPVAVDDGVDAHIAGDLAVGASVSVAPDDYGRIPVTGTLVAYTRHQVVIARRDEQAGDLMVHFPTFGFEVKPVA
ncbi:MAG: glutathione S-transferase family protein [Pseudomonadota bacterium]